MDLTRPNTIKITISRPQGIFQMSGFSETKDMGIKETWNIELKATTKKGKTVQASQNLMAAHDREIRAVLESSRWVLYHYGRGINY